MDVSGTVFQMFYCQAYMTSRFQINRRQTPLRNRAEHLDRKMTRKHLLRCKQMMQPCLPESLNH